jgi:hypothetical protein
MDINAVFERIMRLARLDTTVFDEVRDDERELIPSLVVAAISILLAGFGAFLWWTFSDYDDSVDSLFLNTVILGTIFAIVLYGVAALAIYVVLAQMFRITVDLQALVRTLGYAAIPWAVSVLMFIPVIWPIFSLVPLALLFVMMIYATQSASNAEARQAVIATTIGFAVMVGVLGLIANAVDFPDAPMGAGQFGILFDQS